jgi:hypothetical protein
MNKTNLPAPDLDGFLKRTFMDDCPLDAEERMNRRFLELKRSLDRNESIVEQERRQWARWFFGRKSLAMVSAILLILGGALHLTSDQSVLAHSIERLKVMVTVSTSLYRATSMDCFVLMPDAGSKRVSYRIRWSLTDETRVDMESTDGVRTLWISDETISIADSGGSPVRSMAVNTMSPGPIWQPALEFLKPTILKQYMEDQYGLLQVRGRESAASNEFLLMGQDHQQVIEIAVDAKTYLPKTLKKYLPVSDKRDEEQVCLMEVRFLWNHPIPRDLFIPEAAE